MSFEYACPEVPSCDYCPSNKILVTCTPDSTEEGIGSAPDAYDRILRRIQLPKPIHVELIVVLQQILQASFNVSADIEPHGDIGAILNAPFAPLFDLIPGDDIPADAGIFATIEPVP